MKKTTIIPVGKKVLIKLKQADKFVPGTNIIIPDIAQTKEYKGFVVAVGNELDDTIKVGDLIQYADFCVPTVLLHDGEKHLLINFGDIYAILKEH